MKPSRPTFFWHVKQRFALDFGGDMDDAMNEPDGDDEMDPNPAF